MKPLLPCCLHQKKPNKTTQNKNYRQISLKYMDTNIVKHNNKTPATYIKNVFHDHQRYIPGFKAGLIIENKCISFIKSLKTNM